jgi:glycosyltransferase involved in cell wall biosynthesis
MISVVIPAYNEADAIVQTVHAIQAMFAEAGYDGGEIIVVDDGSTDDTGALAAQAGARVVSHPSNGGYGRSLKDGILAARNEIIAITDADGTYPVDKIPTLMAELDKGFDMAVGARTGAEYRESVVKAPLRKVLKFLVEFTAGRTIPDINSGLRVFRRATIVPFFSHLCNTFSFTTSMTLAYLMTGLYISYVDIPYYKRVGKTKVRLLKDSAMTLQYIVQAILYYNPLKLFLFMFMSVIALSVVSFLTAAVSDIHVGYYLGLGGLLVALIIFALGMLADLLRQIMVK